MELEMKDLLVKLDTIVYSNLEDKDEAFRDIINQPEFIKQHKEGDKYLMDYSYDAWYLSKIVLD